MTKEEALEIFKDDPYKLELIQEHSDDEGGLTIYTQGICGPLPWPTRTINRPHPGLPAAECGWCLLAGQERKSNDAADLRYGLV